MTDERTLPEARAPRGKPLFRVGQSTWWTVLYVAVIVFVILTRLWNLGARGYSHDEGTHAWEAWKLAVGQGYIHSPAFHGPFGYHFTALILTLFGDNDFTGRLGAALFGIILTILPLGLKRWLGNKGVFAAMLLMAISPVIMFRSRFFRHDPFVAVFNLVLFIAMVRYLALRKDRDLYLAAAMISLGVTTKETTFITYFILGTFLFGLLIRQWLRQGLSNWRGLPAFDLLIVLGTLILPLAAPFPIKLLGHDPLDESAQGVIFSGAMCVVMLALSVIVGLWWDRRRWPMCAGLFYAIFIPLYTTLFTNGQGLATGMVGSLGYWLSQHGVHRGDQPWFYYLVLLFLYEFLPLAVGGAGAVVYALRGDPRERQAPAPAVAAAHAVAAARALPEVSLEPDGPRVAGPAPSSPVEDAESKGRTALDGGGLASQAVPVPVIPFLIYWFVMALLIYSWAGEKMPWLTMHIIIPLQILAGWTLGRLLETGRRAARMVGLAVVGVLMVLTLRVAWMATFVNDNYPTEFIVYAHGTPDTPLVAQELEDISRRLYGDLSMKVAYDDESRSPFYWYLRNFANARTYDKETKTPFDEAAVIVGPKNEPAIKPLLGSDYVRFNYRLIWWPYQDWYMQMTPATLWAQLKDPAARHKLWEVIFYRRYDQPLTDWYYVDDFALYIRRDVLQQMWDNPGMLRVGGMR